MFPPGGRRVVFYLFFDPRGVVDEYVLYKLERLRPYAEHVVVVVNGTVNDEGLASLEAVANSVVQRENTGFDVWGYKAALEQFGWEKLAGFDELILMNYTWYGPVGSFGPLFAEMNVAEVDFWGMTEHAAVTPHPYTLRGTMPAHVQSHWIAVRRRMFVSDEWSRYWSDMPMINSYAESIMQHESKFTSHFVELGFVKGVAYPLGDYDSDHPAFDDAQQLLADGCPVLKRRPFFHDPLYLDRHAIIGRRLIDAAGEAGYPIRLILANQARTTPPRVLNTTASLLEILPEQENSYDRSSPLRIAAIVHVFYEDMTDELLDHLVSLPSSFDLYITTTDEAKAAVIAATLESRRPQLVGKAEVRILPSNRGRDLSAFFIGSRDVLRSGDYDLVVKIHSKRTVQQSSAVGLFFKSQQLENLLHSPGYVANLIGLFQREPTLGAVFPPMVHIGFPTLGSAWFDNRIPSAELFERLGIHVPLDQYSPLAPFGAMFVARPEALKLLTDVEWRYDDYAPETEHRDGSLAHVQERSFAYAAGELGFHVRTVANAEYASISHSFLEYKLDQLAHFIPGYAIDQAAELAALTRVRDFLRPLASHMRRRHPRVWRSIKRLLRRGVSDQT